MRTTLFLFIQLFLFSFQLSAQYRVGEKTLVYTDGNRENRPIVTELWYPTQETDPEGNRRTDLPFLLPPTIREATLTDQPCPLVLLSHGTGGNRFGLAWLATALAEKGYIVAAPDHWGNTFDNIIPEYFLRYWERPLDISFLIRQLLVDPQLAAHIDPERIGVAGFSLGGYTSLALAGAELSCTTLMENARTEEGKKEFEIPELDGLAGFMDDFSCEGIPFIPLQDQRIKAFVAMAPALGLGFRELQQTSAIQSPVLIIGAGGDQIAPVRSNAGNYHQLIPGSIYMELDDPAGHYIFLSEPLKELKEQNLIYYTDPPTVNRSLIHQQIQEFILHFFDETIR
ncbi:MAG: hypothetical protein LUG51_14940 [Tannerellaceae bacterium]|nr:hypothetical protein [Tannerellaceae bacterium]